jgi:metallo-beta-lactamase family protein
MNISHHGAVDGVTGSCHQLHINAQNSILIDCGLFQGAEMSRSGSTAKPHIDFELSTVKALVVTHVHIDHVGRIPYLIAAGFRGPIYCSQPSAVLLPLVLEDALRIGVSKDKDLIDKFLGYIKKQIVPLVYNQWSAVELSGEDKLTIRLQRAGHILGSAYVECKVECKAECKSAINGRKTIVVFSGDLGAPNTPLLPAPKSPHAADTLIIESTYGDRQHPDRSNRKALLQKTIKRAFENSGVVLIPAFSIGRTQELLYELEEITNNPKWKSLEVVVDSPLASRFTKAYRQLSPYWDEEAKKRLRAGRHPLDFDSLITVDSHDEHLKLVNYLKQRARPCVVITASGMCAGGRIVNYLKALIEDDRTDILFVGYQASGTPGQVIQRYGSSNGYVELDGERYSINAGVYSLGGYSAHADQRDLVNFVRRIKRSPKEVRIVHGDKGAKQALKRKLDVVLPQADIWMPG